MQYLSPLLSILVVAAADQATCNTLRSLNVNKIAFAESNCACSDPSPDQVQDACSLCIQSTTAGTFKGVASSVALKDTVGTSYSQLTYVETCFHYQDGVYNGKKICYAFKVFGSNIDSQCSITIDGEQCNQCQFNQVTLGFDCTNVNGEIHQTAAFGEAAQGSVLQFLVNTKSATGCALVTNTGGTNETGDSSDGFALCLGIATLIAATVTLFL